MLRARYLDGRLFATRLFGAWLFNSRLFNPWLLDARQFRSGLFHNRRRGYLGSRLAMSLMGLRFRLGFALHLQAMLLQLLRID